MASGTSVATPGVAFRALRGLRGPSWLRVHVMSTASPQALEIGDEISIGTTPVFISLRTQHALHRTPSGSHDARGRIPGSHAASRAVRNVGLDGTNGAAEPGDEGAHILRLRIRWTSAANQSPLAGLLPPPLQTRRRHGRATFKVGISNRETAEEEARERQANPAELEGGETQPQDDRPATHDGQSSSKSGTKASAQKRDTTRHTENTAPAAAKVQGAFGKEPE